MLGESSFTFPESTLRRLDKLKYLKSSLNLYKVKELLEKYKFNQEINSNKITFKTLFEFLIEKKIILLGIFRAPTASISQKYVFLAPSKETIVNTEKDEVYVISSEEEQDLEEQKKNLKQYDMTLIEKTNKVFREMSDMARKNVDDIINNLREEFNVKNVVGVTRNSLRNQFCLAYQKKEEEVIKLAKEEFNKQNVEIKEDSSEAENDDSDTKNSKSSKSS